MMEEPPVSGIIDEAVVAFFERNSMMQFYAPEMHLLGYSMEKEI
jgi:hypothetical protein